MLLDGDNSKIFSDKILKYSSFVIAFASRQIFYLYVLYTWIENHSTAYREHPTANG